MSTKRELCQAEDAGWAAFWGPIRPLTPEQIERSGYTSAGWSVKDLMAHIAAWQAECGRVLQTMQMGTYRRERLDLDEVNRRFYEANRDLPLPVVTAELFSARTRMLQSFSEAPDDVPAADEWFRESGAEHYAEHLPRLQAWAEHLRSGA